MCACERVCVSVCVYNSGDIKVTECDMVGWELCESSETAERCGERKRREVGTEIDKESPSLLQS